MNLVGLLTVDAAIAGIREQTSIAEKMLTDLPTTSPDTSVSDILPLATETRFPISVISKDGSFEGIVTKASVLSALSMQRKKRNLRRFRNKQRSFQPDSAPCRICMALFDEYGPNNLKS